MVWNRVHILPVVLFITAPATFILTYIISVSLDHVEAGFPYISDTGTHSPESCIFGQLLNLNAALTAVIIYVRYRQVKHFLRDDDPRPGKVNFIAYILGLFAALGLSIVANFQETNVIEVHIIGALIAFGVGMLYAWFQVYISFRTKQMVDITNRMCYIRLGLCIFATIMLFITVLAAGMANAKWNGGSDKTKWFPEDGGFSEHVVSTVAEWLMSFAYISFILTFTCEFRRLQMNPPELTFFITLEGQSSIA